MNILFIKLVRLFIKDYQEEVYATYGVVKSAKRDIKNKLDELAAERLQPVISKYFKDGIIATNKIVSQDVAKLADILKIPFKYDKSMLERFNSYSVFQGYYDKNYADLFSKREIDNLKRVILRGKYSNMPDRELAKEIQDTINITKNRALVIARGETQRLDTAAKQILFESPKVKKEYDLVWRTAGDDMVRDNHRAYNGKIADENGYFDGPDGKIKGPEGLHNPWNCRCQIIWVKKDK